MKTLLMAISLSILFLFPVEAKSQTLQTTARYAVAGGPHLPDDAATREISAESQESSVAGTTPINWLLFIRALFVASLRN